MNEKTEKRLVVAGTVVWFAGLAVALLAAFFGNDGLSDLATLCAIAAYAAVIGLAWLGIRLRRKQARQKRSLPQG